MKICEWTERVALSAGGESVEGLERHVAECAQCRVLLTELLADREALGRAPDIPESAYTAVRARVMAEVGVRRRPWVWAAAASFVAVTAGLLWVGVALRRPVERLEIVVSHPAVVSVPTPVARQDVRREPARSRVRVRPAEDRVELAMALRDVLGMANTAPARSDAPVLITAVTADPDVVIVLVPETKGELNE